MDAFSIVPLRYKPYIITVHFYRISYSSYNVSSLFNAPFHRTRQNLFSIHTHTHVFLTHTDIVVDRTKLYTHYAAVVRLMRVCYTLS